MTPDGLMSRLEHQRKAFMSLQRHKSDRPGYHLIFRPWVTIKKTGKRIYRKNGKMFAIWIKN